MGRNVWAGSYNIKAFQWLRKQMSLKLFFFIWIPSIMGPIIFNDFEVWSLTCGPLDWCGLMDTLHSCGPAGPTFLLLFCMSKRIKYDLIIYPDWQNDPVDVIIECLLHVLLGPILKVIGLLESHQLMISGHHKNAVGFQSKPTMPVESARCVIVLQILKNKIVQ